MVVKVLELSTDRIRFRKPNGDLRLDTDFGLFHVVGPVVIGSMSMPQTGAASGATNTPANYQIIDTVIASGRNAACTDVVGAIYMGGLSGKGAAFNRWTSYMGGTLVWAHEGYQGAPIGQQQPFPTLGMTYTFFMSGTNLVMRQVYHYRATGLIVRINAHTIQWKLKTGLWT